MPFIVFEGLDGSGKSTLMGLLLKELDNQKIKYATTREPGGTPLGDKLRDLIVNKGETAPVPRAELLLYEASRAQLVENWIKPKLKDNHWVISDRFSASSVAFQCGGRSLPRAEVEWLNQYATQGLEPECLVSCFPSLMHIAHHTFYFSGRCLRQICPQIARRPGNREKQICHRAG